MILVTGAAGKTGKAVIGALAAQDLDVRAFIRTPEKSEGLGARESAIGDLTDVESLEAAFVGVGRVYHICPNIHPQEIQIGENVLLAAQRARVERIVFHSVLHPQVQAMPHHWYKLKVEEMVINCGIDFTILQPASYMQNLAGSRTSILEQGEIRVPYPIDVPFSPVDLLDVAEVAAGVISAPGHSGATYELAGPQVLTTAGMASVVGQALGKEVRAREIALEDWGVVAGIDEERRGALRAMFRYYSDHGFWGNPRTLTQLLGREPNDFEAFIRREFVIVK
jgi:uncharacterized protein YbjT (DUF2867 family)